MSEVVKKETRVDRWVKYAQIFAFVASPIAVAGVGWLAQQSVAESGIKRDYVQMAAQILREPRKPDDEAARQWAAELINKFSPVSFSDKAASQLSQSSVAMLHNNPLLKPAMEEELPPCPKVSLAGIPAEKTQSVATLEALCARNAYDRLWLRTFIKLIGGSGLNSDKEQEVSSNNGRAH
ncbi:hypothetical protein LL998_33175 (plasmid) [Burkholderia ambifaria]|uniref:hypothetical protein n=1 Tax=Burkholderia ambifaria TaxID=152480 RepID=UPI001E3D84C4|nr:hypothetical protein [Burkholderia ambifaria]UEP39792.1 hypothetical protein LL998_33175 [Burkholderia ambifaria]